MKVRALALALMVATGCVSLTTPEAASASPTCPSVYMIGVRGSGETFQYGATVGDVVRRTKVLRPDVRSDWVDYPAIAVGYGGFTHYPADYANSVAAGVAALLAKFTAWTTDPCVNYTKLFLVGYSQGAQVVGDFVSQLTPRGRTYLWSGALIADPQFKGSSNSIVDGVFNVGDYNPHWNGIVAPFVGARKLSLPMLSQLVSYCQAGDPVCNLSVGNLANCQLHKSTCPHIHYRDMPTANTPYTEEVAEQIDDGLNSQVCTMCLAAVANRTAVFSSPFKAKPLQRCPAGATAPAVFDVDVWNPKKQSWLSGFSYVPVAANGSWSVSLSLSSVLSLPSLPFPLAGGWSVTCYDSFGPSQASYGGSFAVVGA